MVGRGSFLCCSKRVRSCHSSGGFRDSTRSLPGVDCLECDDIDALVVISHGGRVQKKIKVMLTLTCPMSSEKEKSIRCSARMATATACVGRRKEKKLSCIHKVSRAITVIYHCPRSLPTAHADPPIPSSKTETHETASQTRRRPSLLR